MPHLYHHRCLSHPGPTPVRQQPRKSQALAFCLSLLVLVLSGCGVRGDGSGDTTGTSELPGLGGNQNLDYRATPLSCQLDDMKSWVYNSMLDYYLFYDQVNRHVDLGSFSSIETLITSLRVAPYDTFSYITDEQSHTARFTDGETVGFGWVLVRTEADELFFTMVEPASPLAAAGVGRGDRLVAINGLPTLDFFAQGGAIVDAVVSADETPVTIDVTVETPLGVSRTVSVTKALYALQTVLDTRVIEHNGVRVGYMHFYQFLNTSAAELDAAFATLAGENISELVLDLRYNFGGRVMIANELASYIVGQGKTSDAFAVYQPNDKYPENTSTLNFVNKAHALDLSRVFILQSGETCSASELVVNGLRPFMEVITVGSTSCGKPYATIPNTACGKVMNALELEAVNADGIGGYYDGIGADCPAVDSIGQALGNSNENLLSTALGYIDSGSCVTGSTRSARSTPALPPELQSPWFGHSTF